MTIAKLPPGSARPRFVQGAYALMVPRRGMRRMRERYGDAFTVNVPIFGRCAANAPARGGLAVVRRRSRSPRTQAAGLARRDQRSEPARRTDAVTSS